MKTASIITTFATIASLCAGLATSANGAIWQIAALEFSIDNGNPNGVWSYGWQPLGSGEFNAFTQASTVGAAAIWSTGAVPGPYISRLTPDAYQLVLGQANNMVPVLRWTATADMEAVRLHMFFAWPGNDSEASIIMRVNNVEIASITAWKDYGEYYRGEYSGIKTGDTIDFVFESPLETSTTATIVVNPVPEPATYLAGISALGMLFWGFKNRR